MTDKELKETDPFVELINACAAKTSAFSIWYVSGRSYALR